MAEQTTQYVKLASGDLVPLSVQRSEYVNSSSDIKSLLYWVGSQETRAEYRIYLLYHDETIKAEIPQKDIFLGGSYGENYQDGQRRSLSFTLVNEDGKYLPNINGLWAGTRIRLDMGTTLPSGETLWVQKGVFFVQSANPTHTPDGETVEVSCADKFAMFEDKTGTLETTYEIPVGSDIEAVLNGILMSDMGDGWPFDTKPMVFHSSFKGKVTQETITKEAGDTLGSVILDLATQLGAEVFYNAMGCLTLIPTNETGSDYDKPLIAEYDVEEGDADSLGFTFDMSSIVNRVVVIGSSSSGGVVSAVAVNDDPGSPLCYQRIGYRTDGVINDSNITTDMLAEERAAYELRKRLIYKSTSSINVRYNPLVSVNNLVAVTSDFYGLRHERFLIQSLSYPLDYSGSMGLTITNLSNLPSITMASR